MQLKHQSESEITMWLSLPHWLGLKTNCVYTLVLEDSNVEPNATDFNWKEGAPQGSVQALTSQRGKLLCNGSDEGTEADFAFRFEEFLLPDPPFVKSKSHSSFSFSFLHSVGYRNLTHSIQSRALEADSFASLTDPLFYPDHQLCTRTANLQCIRFSPDFLLSRAGLCNRPGRLEYLCEH